MEDQERIFEDEGGITCICSLCAAEIWAEPDAQEAWCDHCGEVVKVKNPLIEAGMI